MAARAQGEGQMRLEALDVQSLNQLKERLNNELQNFARSANQLSLAASKFEESRQSVQQLAATKSGHHLLLPLTQSLYVNGTIAETDKVMIDIGTGYYVEMSSQEGQDYCSRKVKKLQESLMNLQQLMRERQAMLGQVNQILQAKVAAANQGAAQASKA